MTDYAQLLTGEHVRLWPYSSHISPTALVYLWQKINEAGMAHRVFWPHAQKAEQQTLNLEFFLSTMHGALPLLVQDLGTGSIGGLVWFDDVHVGFRGSINLFYERRLWGIKAREGTAIATRYGFEAFGFQSIWGITPWKIAARHGLKLGYKHVATLPKYACVQGELHDVYVFKREK